MTNSASTFSQPLRSTTDYPILADGDRMIRLAEEYCDLIEHLDPKDCAVCLGRMARLLPQLHAAIVHIPLPSPAAVELATPDFETRFELFSRLRQAIGEQDSYWLEYDQGNLEPSGSLADDFTDIYFDLKRGLELAQRGGLERALADWKASFQLHWGQHLVDAERQLYALCCRAQGICR